MPQSSQTLGSWIRQSRKNWSVLTQLGVMILGIVGGFLVPPPPGLSEGDDKTWLRLAQFVITVSVGVIFVATRKRRQKKDATRWWITAALFLIISLSAFFFYKDRTHKWTCSYFGDPVVVGSEYTEMGEHYLNKNPGIPCSQLLTDFAGGVDKVWTKDSIDRHRLELAGIYISCIPLFTVCLFGLLQGVYCLSAKK